MQKKLKEPIHLHDKKLKVIQLKLNCSIAAAVLKKEIIVRKAIAADALFVELKHSRAEGEVWKD